MVNRTLLLVEDDSSLAELLAFRFSNEGYRVRTTTDGAEALAMAEEDPPDIILLDWMLPGISGIEVLGRLRRGNVTRNLPIIMLTARCDEDDRVRGLQAGADDYVTKPFSPRELVVRVSAVLRRLRPALAGLSIEVGDLRLDPVARRIERYGEELKLGPTEYRLLAFFMEHPGRVFSRAQLLDAVWGMGSEIDERTVDVHIRRLRKSVAHGHARDPIRTVRSAGYALERV